MMKNKIFLWVVLMTVTSSTTKHFCNYLFFVNVNQSFFCNKKLSVFIKSHFALYKKKNNKAHFFCWFVAFSSDNHLQLLSCSVKLTRRQCVSVVKWLVTLLWLPFWSSDKLSSSVHFRISSTVQNCKLTIRTANTITSCSSSTAILLIVCPFSCPS